MNSVRVPHHSVCVSGLTVDLKPFFTFNHLLFFINIHADQFHSRAPPLLSVVEEQGTAPS